MSEERYKYVQEIIAYIKETYVLDSSRELPLDKSLVEEGILDSYAVIELVSFLERQFKIRIPDEDITKENLGSIHKMADYVLRHQNPTTTEKPLTV